MGEKMQGRGLRGVGALPGACSCWHPSHYLPSAAMCLGGGGCIGPPSAGRVWGAVGSSWRPHNTGGGSRGGGGLSGSRLQEARSNPCRQPTWGYKRSGPRCLRGPIMCRQMIGVHSHPATASYSHVYGYIRSHTRPQRLCY